jgi:hypothetical protein
VVLDRPAPLWETYFVYPETEVSQRAMIERLASRKVDWALVADVPLDGRDDLRFRHTHRLVWDHLAADFERVRVDGLPDHLLLLRRRPLASR